jgi:hypothetical protein
VEWNWKMQGPHRKRFVCLASLLQTGLHHALLMHQVCGQPLGRLPPPSRLYDGLQFLEVYCRRWDARQAERRRGAAAASTTPDQRPQEQQQQQGGGGGEAGEAPEQQSGDQAVPSNPQDEDEGARNDNDGDDDDKGDDGGDDDDEIDDVVSKAKEAIVAGLRPNPASAKQRAGPSIFKVEAVKKQRRSNADKNGAAQAQAQSSAGSEEEVVGHDGDDDRNHRLSTHNSFALLG